MTKDEFRAHWKRQRLELVIALFKVRLYHLGIAKKYTIEKLGKMAGMHRNAIWTHVNGMYNDEMWLPRHG